MKKYLLLSLAAGTMLSANAATPLSVNESMVDHQSQVISKENVTLKPLAFSNASTKISKDKSFKFFKKVNVAKAGQDAQGNPYYIVPEANLYKGFSIREDHMGFYSLQYSDGTAISEMLAPAYAKQLWVNYSTVNDTDNLPTFTWTYTDPVTNPDGTWGKEASTNTINFEAPVYPFAQVYAPELALGNDSYSASRAICYGGTGYETIQNTSVLCGLLPFNISEGHSLSYADIFAANTNTWRSEIFEEGTSNEILSSFTADGIGQLIGKPAHPYGVTSVLFYGSVTKFTSAQISCSIYEAIIDEEGNVSVGEKLCGGYLPKEEIPVSSTNWVNFEIPLMEEDGDLSYPTYINIDTPVIITIDNLADGDEAYLAAQFIDKTDENAIELSNSVLLCTLQGEKMLLDTKFNWSSGKVNCNFTLGLNMMYTWMDSETEETAYEKPEVWNVPAEGGSKTFVYSPFYDLNDLGVVEGEGSFEWWEAVPEEYDKTAKKQGVTFTVDPLPAGVTGRWTTAKISIPGSYRKISIIQGEVTGIDNVTVGGAEKAELDWNAPVYNVMGQKVSKGFTGIAIQNGNKFIVK